MLIDVMGRLIDFDEETMILHEKLYGTKLNELEVMTQIEAVTVTRPEIKLENMTDEEVISLVRKGLEEDERVFSGLQ